MLKESLARVRERIGQAAHKAGRGIDEITLLAVTKKFDSPVLREAWSMGLREFGENYVQEWETKAPQLADLKDLRVHLIGHLQSNKAKTAASLFGVIQTVDTAKLAERLNQTGAKIDVMLEVKLSQEEAKAGAFPEDIPALADFVRHCANLRLTGLMTMPPWSSDPEQSRSYFKRLHKLAEASGLSGLSMGMSHDLEVAIEEGSTCVRVGTALFGPRVKQ